MKTATACVAGDLATAMTADDARVADVQMPATLTAMVQSATAVAAEAASTPAPAVAGVGMQRRRGQRGQWGQGDLWQQGRQQQPRLPGDQGGRGQRHRRQLRLQWPPGRMCLMWGSTRTSEACCAARFLAHTAASSAAWFCASRLPQILSFDSFLIC